MQQDCIERAVSQHQQRACTAGHPFTIPGHSLAVAPTITLPGAGIIAANLAIDAVGIEVEACIPKAHRIGIYITGRDTQGVRKPAVDGAGLLGGHVQLANTANVHSHGVIDGDVIF